MRRNWETSLILIFLIMLLALGRRHESWHQCGHMSSSIVNLECQLKLGTNNLGLSLWNPHVIITLARSFSHRIAMKEFVVISIMATLVKVQCSRDLRKDLNVMGFKIFRRYEPLVVSVLSSIEIWFKIIWKIHKCFEVMDQINCCLGISWVTD